MEGRRLFGRRDLLAVLGVVLAALIWLLLARAAPGGATAVVELDGQVVMTRDLTRLDGTESAEIEGRNGIALTVEFSSEGARIAQSGCPDKTCQRTGWLIRAGDSAVCLPGRVVLRLEGPGGAGMDAETY